MSSSNESDNDKSKFPECNCGECSKTLAQIGDVHTHLSKMYSNINSFNQSIQAQNESLSKVYRELIPLLKNIDARLKQNHALLEKLSQ